MLAPLEGAYFLFLDDFLKYYLIFISYFKGLFID